MLSDGDDEYDDGEDYDDYNCENEDSMNAYLCV
jgi:hypothetical protein